MEFKAKQFSSKTLLEKKKKDNSHTVSESQDNFYGGAHSHLGAHELLCIPGPESVAKSSLG